MAWKGSIAVAAHVASPPTLGSYDSAQRFIAESLTPLRLKMADGGCEGGFNGFISHLNEAPILPEHVEAIEAWFRAAPEVARFVIDGPMSQQELLRNVLGSNEYPQCLLEDDGTSGS